MRFRKLKKKISSYNGATIVVPYEGIYFELNNGILYERIPLCDGELVRERSFDQVPLQCINYFSRQLR